MVRLGNTALTAGRHKNRKRARDEEEVLEQNKVIQGRKRRTTKKKPRKM